MRRVSERFLSIILCVAVVLSGMTFYDKQESIVVEAYNCGLELGDEKDRFEVGKLRSCKNHGSEDHRSYGQSTNLEYYAGGDLVLMWAIGGCGHANGSGSVSCTVTMKDRYGNSYDKEVFSHGESVSAAKGECEKCGADDQTFCLKCHINEICPQNSTIEGGDEQGNGATVTPGFHVYKETSKPKTGDYGDGSKTNHPFVYVPINGFCTEISFDASFDASFIHSDRNEEVGALIGRADKGGDKSYKEPYRIRFQNICNYCAKHGVTHVLNSDANTWYKGNYWGAFKASGLDYLQYGSNVTKGGATGHDYQQATASYIEEAKRNGQAQDKYIKGYMLNVQATLDGAVTVTKGGEYVISNYFDPVEYDFVAHTNHPNVDNHLYSTYDPKVNETALTTPEKMLHCEHVDTDTWHKGNLDEYDDETYKKHFVWDHTRLDNPDRVYSLTGWACNRDISDFWGSNVLSTKKWYTWEHRKNDVGQAYYEPSYTGGSEKVYTPDGNTPRHNSTIDICPKWTPNKYIMTYKTNLAGNSSNTNGDVPSGGNVGALQNASSIEVRTEVDRWSEKSSVHVPNNGGVKQHAKTDGTTHALEMDAQYGKNVNSSDDLLAPRAYWRVYTFPHGSKDYYVTGKGSTLDTSTEDKVDVYRQVNNNVIYNVYSTFINWWRKPSNEIIAKSIQTNPQESIFEVNVYPDRVQRYDLTGVLQGHIVDGRDSESNLTHDDTFDSSVALTHVDDIYKLVSNPKLENPNILWTRLGGSLNDSKISVSDCPISIKAYTQSQTLYRVRRDTKMTTPANHEVQATWRNESIVLGMPRKQYEIKFDSAGGTFLEPYGTSDVSKTTYRDSKVLTAYNKLYGEFEGHDIVKEGSITRNEGGEVTGLSKWDTWDFMGWYNTECANDKNTGKHVSRDNICTEHTWESDDSTCIHDSDDFDGGSCYCSGVSEEGGSCTHSYDTYGFQNDGKNPYKPSCNVNLYAHWQDPRITLPEVKRLGYTFIGWFTEPQPVGSEEYEGKTGLDGIGAGLTKGGVYYGGGQDWNYDSIALHNFDKDMTLYAWYNRDPVYVDLYEGLFFEGQKVTYNDLLQLIDVFDYEDNYKMLATTLVDKYVTQKLEKNLDLTAKLDSDAKDIEKKLKEIEEKLVNIYDLIETDLVDHKYTKEELEAMKEKLLKEQSNLEKRAESIQENLHKLFEEKEHIEEQRFLMYQHFNQRVLEPTIVQVGYYGVNDAIEEVKDEDGKTVSVPVEITDKVPENPLDLNDNKEDKGKYDLYDYHSDNEADLTSSLLYKSNHTYSKDLYDSALLDTSTARIGKFKVTYQVHDEGIYYIDIEGEKHFVPRSDITIEYTRTCQINFNYNPILHLQNIVHFSSDSFDEEDVISQMFAEDHCDLNNNAPWWSWQSLQEKAGTHKPNFVTGDGITLNRDFITNEVLKGDDGKDLVLDLLEDTNFDGTSDNYNTYGKLQDNIIITGVTEITFDSAFEYESPDEVKNFLSEYKDGDDWKYRESPTEVYTRGNNRNEILKKLLETRGTNFDVFRHITSINVTFDTVDQWGKYASNKVNEDRAEWGVDTSKAPDGYKPEFNGGNPVPEPENPDDPNPPYDPSITQNEEERSIRIILIDAERDPDLASTYSNERIRYISENYINTLVSSYWNTSDKSSGLGLLNVTFDNGKSSGEANSKGESSEPRKSHSAEKGDTVITVNDFTRAIEGVVD